MEVEQEKILRKLEYSRYSISSLELSEELGCDHERVIGLIKSLESRNKIKTEFVSDNIVTLTEEGKNYFLNGTPEFRLISLIIGHEEHKIKQDKLISELGNRTFKIGSSKCLQKKLIKLNKDSGTVELIKDINSEELKVDEVREELSKIGLSGIKESKLEKAQLNSVAELKKRKLVSFQKLSFFNVFQGEDFSLELKQVITDLTQEMIINSTWQNNEFKQYNFNAKGKYLHRGTTHPLTRTQRKFKRILTQMGFEEMPTNRWVESSFWNFDALFQPQKHPARDSHDTFFLKTPSTFNNEKELDPTHVDKVKQVHEIGGYDSIGLSYNWSIEEASKNLLRTHTTAVSVRILYQLAQKYLSGESGYSFDNFKRKAYFSIDRVFRNESIDATHLAEFHQVEGLIIDKDLSLADLMGTLTTFYEKIGISNLKFKPAFNPYTEPSMEIFGYHNTLKKWIEVGNSGIFRPEMLRPLGFPPNIVAIAWGLSLERPTMISYNIPNIRDLFSYKAKIFD
ncbi:phenylalanyl-trna synthetase-like protein [Cryptosporidium ryanae]|uniref:phenylalanyl-trna synthetase-like protein n=1 Tax=Cryptosporidium ryanae TaxID=515981 RepID=UPI003519F1BA|nr:phenylalanyl-trna synthetase-like protein [Cryptosporidium ryanae]